MTQKKEKLDSFLKLNREHIASLELNDYLDLLKKNYENPNSAAKNEEKTQKKVLKPQQKWPERATPYSREWIPGEDNGTKDSPKQYSYNKKY